MQKKTSWVDDEIKNFFIISAIVIVIVLIFFWLTSIRINRPFRPEVPNYVMPAKIQFSEILMGSIYNMPEDNYFVYVKLNENPLFEYLLEINEMGYRYYIVDLNRFFNKQHISDKTNYLKLEFANSTILLIQKGKIFKEFDTNQKDIDYFNGES